MVPWGQHLTAFTGGSPSYANVTLSSAESNLQSVAVQSAVDLIASLASELPAHVYSGDGADRRQRTVPGYLLDPGGDGRGLADWAYQVLVSWLLRGNLYGEILEMSPSGFPTQVALQHPDTVGAWIDRDGQVQWQVGGKPVDQPDRWMHRRVNPIPGQVLGLSPVEFHATQIGLSLTASRFGLQWFRDGAHPSGMLVNSEVMLNKDQIRGAKDLFMAAVFGSREPLVMGKGWEYKPLQVTPEESQFLATQGYTEAQCARIFGPGIAEILGYESGGSLTYANVDSRLTHLLILALNKWLRRFERLLTEMLPRPQYVRIDRDALLQSTTLDRYRAHESGIKNGWRTINEVRADEDLPPVPWGNEPFTAKPAGQAGADAPADGPKDGA